MLEMLFCAGGRGEPNNISAIYRQTRKEAKMKNFTAVFLAVVAAAFPMTSVVAQETGGKQGQNAATETINGTIVGGDEDQLSSTGVPIGVPPAGEEIGFQEFRDRLNINEKMIAALVAQIENLDETASNHAAQTEALNAQISVLQSENTEIREFLLLWE